MRFLFTGGGTAGSVTPLLAVVSRLKQHNPNAQFLWLGTYSGPEKKLVSAAGLPFMAIASGKLRRYFSLRNFIDPFFILAGFIQSVYIIKRYNPDIIVSAGGFVSVPAAYAGWFFRKKIITHQLDIQKGLANKLMGWVADKITVSFPESLNDFPSAKTEHIGTPVRDDLFSGDKSRAMAALGLDPEFPTILVLGGGTGSLILNKMVISSLPEILNFAQVIHITGKGKGLPAVALKEKEKYYHQFEFVVDELPNMFSVADVVVSRAGIGTLAELAALGKASIIFPIPNSQQELNANYFKEKKAVLVFDQRGMSAQKFTEELRGLLLDRESVRFLENRIHLLYLPNAADRLSEIIFNLINKNGN